MALTSHVQIHDNRFVGWKDFSYHSHMELLYTLRCIRFRLHKSSCNIYIYVHISRIDGGKVRTIVVQIIMTFRELSRVINDNLLIQDRGKRVNLNSSLSLFWSCDGKIYFNIHATNCLRWETHSVIQVELFIYADKLAWIWTDLICMHALLLYIHVYLCKTYNSHMFDDDIGCDHEWKSCPDNETFWINYLSWNWMHRYIQIKNSWTYRVQS